MTDNKSDDMSTADWFAQLADDVDSPPLTDVQKAQMFEILGGTK